MSKTVTRCVVALVLAVLVLDARGQVPPPAGGEGTVTGMGTATIKRQADLMRVQVQLVGEGKDLAAALAKLKERRESARKKLVALGAAEGSIVIDDPQPQEADRRQQMERMVRMRGRGARQPATSPADAGPVRVAATVKAEWALPKGGGEEALLAASALREKVKAADLGEAKLASLEEQEAREEAAAAAMDDGQAAVAPGEPVFLYVGKISEEERAKGMADAFKKARASAAALAKAAGAELGPIRQLSGQASNSYDQYRYMQYNRGMYGGYMGDEEGGGAAADEALSMQPGPVTLMVSVSASFALK